MRIALVALALAGIAYATCRGRDQPPVVVATFNIEDFPKDDRQVTAAFDEIAALGASIVAVEEITDPERFAGAAHSRLGADWQFVSAPDDKSHRLGVLFDHRRWTLRSRRIHDGTRLGGHLPVFEVRLAPVDGGSVVRVYVVHLKSGAEGRGVRVRQLAALDGIVRAAGGTGERVVVLGDFNATEPGDRTDLARLAKATGLAWATEPLACTAFWDRFDGCPTSRLDHVLIWSAPSRVVVAGACASEGCAWHDRCPLYADEVSDHCPVVVTIDR